ncbi:MAG: hypothetical protein JO357_14380 [Hyphomicrobiales bacterium]|nr:hypothetical protein [Hyphomicrobiales bacterium]
MSAGSFWGNFLIGILIADWARLLVLLVNDLLLFLERLFVSLVVLSHRPSHGESYQSTHNEWHPPVSLHVVERSAVAGKVIGL